MVDFKFPAQPPPLGRVMENDQKQSLFAGQETQQKLGALIEFIGPFTPPKRILSADGRVFDVLAIELGTAAGGLAFASTSHPWKVSVRENPESPGSFQAKVELESYLLKTLQGSDIQTVTGLDTWFPLLSDDIDVIWIEIPVTDYASSGASIDSYGQSDNSYDPEAPAWTTGGFVVSEDGGDPTSPQTALRVMIAFSQPDPESGIPTMHQRAYNHLYLSIKPTETRPALIATPTPYGAYNPT